MTLARRLVVNPRLQRAALRQPQNPTAMNLNTHRPKDN